MLCRGLPAALLTAVRPTSRSAFVRAVHVESRLTELGITLPPPGGPKANYQTACFESPTLVHQHSQSAPGQRPGQAPVPPQGACGGSGRRGTPRKRPVVTAESPTLVRSMLSVPPCWCRSSLPWPPGMVHGTLTLTARSPHAHRTASPPKRCACVCQLYVSGHLPVKLDGSMVTGSLGPDGLSLEEVAS